MYPDRDTLSNVPRSGYITARDQSMVESGVTEGGKNTARSCQFFFFGNEHILRSCPVPIIPLCLFMSLLSSQRSKEAKKNKIK